MMLWFQLCENYSNLLVMTCLDFKFEEITSLVSPQRGYLINLNNSAETYVSYHSENSAVSTVMAVIDLRQFSVKLRIPIVHQNFQGVI